MWIWGDTNQSTPGGHYSACRGCESGPLSSECSCLDHPLLGLGSALAGTWGRSSEARVALGSPHSWLPPKTAHLLPTKCPGSQFKEASLTTVEFLSSAAGGDLSVCINDHHKGLVDLSGASSSHFPPSLRSTLLISALLCSYPSPAVLSPQSGLVWRAFKMC